MSMSALFRQPAVRQPVASVLFALIPSSVSAQLESGMGISGSGVAVTYLKSASDNTDYFNTRITGEFFRSKTWSVSAVARYQYIHTDISAVNLSGTGYSPESIGLNGSHNVYQLGLNSFARTSLWNKPLVSFAMMRADFSTCGFERVNAMAAAMLMVKATRDTQFGIGPMLLLNTSSKWPVFPIFIYRHRFCDKLSLNLYGAIFGIDYTPTRLDYLSAGFDIDARSFYFRPGVEDLPSVCRYTKTLFRPMAKYRRKLTKHLSAEIEGGVELKMSSRIYGKTGTRHYLEVRSPASPFVQATVSGSF